ncbi:MAG TPA: hypothetical protein VI548_12865 [Chitinophagaceae bacterium]|nr:hypothetical protein [Chitinophagaceae bacterium]
MKSNAVIATWFWAGYSHCFHHLLINSETDRELAEAVETELMNKLVNHHNS